MEDVLGTALQRPRRRDTPANVALLTDLDEADGQVSGPATKEVLRQHYEVHGDPAFEWLASIFNGHIYNVRKTRTYR